jgi:acyl transferase domain-containing protein/acyl-CoA synthetase (AMP-forming)/AMP-acid ligase II/SAM-dependent methyltransferase/acyl carrier protein
MASIRPESDVFPNLIDLLRKRAGQGGDHGFRYLAGRDDREERLSLVDLDRRSRAVASLLVDRGLRGERAMLCYPPGVEFLVGLFGSLYAGMVAVPAYPPRSHKPDARLAGIASSCRPGVILAPASLVDECDGFAELNPSLGGVPWLATDSVPDDRADTWAAPQVGGDDLAILQYTSGSTGDPKGVMLSHACVLHNVRAIARSMDLRRDNVGVCWLPAFHDMGLIGNLLGTVYFPGTLTLLSPLTMMQDPFRWLDAVSRTKADISGGPCFAYDLCVKRISDEQRSRLDLSHWRVAYTGAEPISSRILEAFTRRFAECGFRAESLYPCYGLAESALMVTGVESGSGVRVVAFDADALAAGRGVPDADGREMVGCGRPAMDLEVRIVDAETCRLLPSGEVGEVWVAGPSVAMGYFERPESTQETFGANLAHGSTRHLRTGDLGFLHEGELFIAGRLKDVLIIRGRNYYPQDIEEVALLASTLLRPGGAAAFTPEDDESRLVLVAEVQRSYKPGQGELFDALRARIAEEFGIELSDLVLIRPATLPRTSSGKIARRETRQRHQDGGLEVVERFTVVETVPSPANIQAADLRDWLIHRLASQLGLAPGQIDADRPFASFGLDSVAMVGMAADLERRLGRRLSPTMLYSAPTVLSLVRLLTESAPVAESSAPKGDRRIAIIGIGCRLPGADGVDAFWKLLQAGEFAVRDLPEARRADCRQETPTKAGYLDEVRSFDAAFFALTGREASCIDPQHRLLLEVAYHAIEDAAVPADRLAGSRTGVFVGISGNDYGRLLLGHAGADAYLGIGNAGSMAAHRLSYHLDLRGPSLAVDTACSSSLSAVHLACQSLLADDCDMALAGGVNLILTPDVTESLSRAKMLSQNERCKTFDASADGYVRGEGCGVVVLKPLATALRDGDPIRAVIEATATNQDGRSNGITAPNGAAQTALIRRTLALADRSPGDIGAIEAHGTGTSLGDPIEFDALAEAIGASAVPCALSAVKTNIGHLEAAAGIAGLIKSALQLEHGRLAPHLHLDEVNPLIGLAGSRFFVPTTASEWPANSPRVAGVSSFGFGGTNVHALLAAAPERKGSVAGVEDPGARHRRPLEGSEWRATGFFDPSHTSHGRSRHLLPLSAKSGAALQDLARTTAEFLRRRPDVSLADISRTLGTGRTHMPYRLVVQGDTGSAIAEQIEAWLHAGRSQAVQAGKVFDDPPFRVGFLFTGQGAAYAGMARHLDETEPAFRAALDRCEEILQRCAGFSLREVLGDASRVEETEYGQPVLFAFGYALAELWRSWGVQPAAMLGHSVGEYVAATQAGVFSLEDGLTLIAARGALMQASPAGAMLACLASAQQVLPALDEWATRVSLAANNGPRQCVLSGDAEALAAVALELTARGIDSRLLRVTRAFHSALIEPALGGLRAAAARIVAHAPSVPLVSNLTGEFHGDAPTAGYWVDHARSPVRFEAGIRAMHRAGITHFVEIGPAAVLTRLGAACLDGTDAVWLSSQRGEGDDGAEILRSLSRLHVDGAKLAWDRIAADGRRISLPGYAFQRRPYWVTDLPAESRTPMAEAKVEPVEATSTFVMRSAWGQAIERRPATFGDVPSLVSGVVDQTWSDHPLDAAVRLRPEFDHLAGLYVASALGQLGWRPARGEAIELTALARRLNLPARQERLLGRMLGLAAEDGWMTWDGTRGEVRSLPPGDDPGAFHAALLQKYPAFDVELRLADHCARHLAGVLSGEVDPLHVLFGSEAGTLTEDIYAKSPVSRFYNDLLTNAVARLLAALPEGRPVRILELGAGTGGTTQALLPILPATRCEYVFSDVSSLFLAKAREKFAAYPWIDHRVLDLEQDLAGQGFADGQFDLVVAANVLHATADLRQSVRGARRLLAPGGVLVLLEGTGPRRLLDLIFGLTEGWWRFRDTDVRPDYPLISPASWASLLREEGFTGTLALPEGDERLPDPDQVILLASAGAASARRTRPAARPFGWLVCGSESPLLVETVARLRNEGQSVVAARPEVFDAVRTQLNGSAPSRVIFLPGSMRTPGGPFEQVWLVSCGDADLRSGAWGAKGSDGERAVDLDPSLIPAAQAAQLVEAILRGDECSEVIYRDGQRYVRPTPVKAERVGTQARQEVAPAIAPDRAALLAATPFERRGLVDRYLRQELARLLGNPLSDDDMDMPVQSLGLDSLMAIQVRNRVEAGLGVALSLVDFLKGLRVRQLVDNIVKQLPEKPPEAARAVAKRDAAVSVAASEVRSLSETELDSLLASMLETR